MQTVELVMPPSPCAGLLALLVGKLHQEIPGMKYERFEDLPVWQAAEKMARRVYWLTRRRFFSQPGDLCDQLRRAALSVSNNIAEGFESGSTAELLHYLYIARGSAGEVRSALRFTLGLIEDVEHESMTANLRSEIANLKSQISDLKSPIAEIIALAESCSRQIRAWADSLQNSDIKGQRHLTDQTRAADQSRRRAETFREQIKQSFRESRPELFKEPNKEP
jgi:four helix bundle protein